MRKPTHKQQAFAEAYTKTGHGTNSAIMAGYAVNSAAITATKLLKKTNIRNEILRLKKQIYNKVEEKIVIDAAWVLDKSRDLHEYCVRDFEQMHDAQGKPMVDEASGEPLYRKLEHNVPGAAKSLELVGKHKAVKAFVDDEKGNLGAEIAAFFKGIQGTLGPPSER